MTVTEYFTRLQGKRVLVLGLGVSNRPLVRLLLRFGIDITGCDRTPREKLDPEVLELERLGAKLHLGDDYLTGISGDVAFRTPVCTRESRSCRRCVPQGRSLPRKWRPFSRSAPAGSSA